MSYGSFQTHSRTPKLGSAQRVSMRRFINIIVNVLFPALCFYAPYAIAGEAETQANVESFINEGFNFFSSSSLPTELRKLGGLLSETKSIARNVEKPNMRDSNHVFDFRDLRVWISCAPAGSNQCVLTDVVLSQSGRKAKFGICVGMRAFDLIAILGKPHDGDKKSFTYNSESSSVVFKISADRVKEIRWEIYAN